MTVKIAIAGKGGTGKTTLSALLIQYLAKNHPGKSIFAIDADANANLNEVLGLEVEETISDILDSIKDPKAVPTGMTKDMYVQYGISRAIVEMDAYDLLVMGNPQGPGCYCFPLDLLSKYLERMAQNYDYMVTDNEAGLEHISRRVIPSMDYLLIISDATVRGIRSAGRVKEIAERVKIDIGKTFLIISRGDDEQLAALKNEIDKTGLTLLGVVPYDSLIPLYDLEGRALVDLPADSVSLKASEDLFRKLGL
ncbi:MAG: AAA family ATPase [Firmicutes bacterium]|nr:AAA family ATPase [Bacillota bacterium]